MPGRAGLARPPAADDIREVILRLEEDLGAAMGYLALFPGLPEPEPGALEEIVERVRAVTGETFRFVRPGDSLPGAALHLARTIARRAERVAVGLHRDGGIDNSAYAWLNRLSDAIYAISLWTDWVNSGRR